MKIRRNIYLTLGILFVLINVLTTLLQFREIMANLADGIEGIAYLIGTQIFLYIGLAFLYSSRRVQQKINLKERRALEDAFMDGGNNM